MKVNCLTRKGEEETISMRGLLNMTKLMIEKLSKTH